MTYVLGTASRKQLIGVKPQLVMVVNAAINVTTQDFTVYEGHRTMERQKLLKKQGYSQTLDSMHLEQADGFSHAVDLVPWINGHPVWDWDGCYLIALAMDSEATRLGLAKNIRWGGCWDKRLSDFGGDALAYKKAVSDYVVRHPGKDFLDGPHFEWRD